MLLFPDALLLLLAALVLDALVGDPDVLWRRWPHPVVWIGKLIAFLDRHLNRPADPPARRRINGVLVLGLLVAGSLAAGYGIEILARQIPHGGLLVVVLAAIFIAQKSLYEHVAAVRDGLLQNGIEGGRKAVAMIVGRDPEQLDEAGVCRASIESCAENFSDGVVAPAFWFALFGLPGLLAYKAVNTADSMIGHKTERHGAFGWASARFDDIVNLPASRLSGVLIAFAAPLAGVSITKAFRTISRDAGKHRSPNAGWPEAAMAGALDIALAGPRIYPGYTVDDPYMNEAGRRDIDAASITRALRILVAASALLAGVVACFAIVFVL